MPLDIFHVKSLTVFLLCLCCVGGATKIAACIANLQYADTMHYLTLFFAIRIMTACAEFLNALYGFSGALSDSAIQLWRFTIVMSLLVVFELMVMTFRYCNKEYLTLGYTTGVLHSKPLEDIEREYKCCGTTGPSEYTERNMPMPRSCFSKDSRSKEDVLHAIGCRNAIEYCIHEKHYRGTIIFSVFICVELAALCSTARLAYRLAKERPVQLQQV